MKTLVGAAEPPERRPDVLATGSWAAGAGVTWSGDPARATTGTSTWSSDSFGYRS